VIPIPIPAFSPEESSFVVFLEGEYVAVTATIDEEVLMLVEIPMNAVDVEDIVLGVCVAEVGVVGVVELVSLVGVLGVCVAEVSVVGVVELVSLVGELAVLEVVVADTLAMEAEYSEQRA
jgi:hypothetical protein